MTSAEDPIAELSALLMELNATPVLVRSRLAPSTLYDMDYHIAMIGCAFVVHANVHCSKRRILAPWLKLLQFAAARPHVAPDLQRWEGQRRDDLEAWSRMPRGYLGDRTHDAAVDLLVARSVFIRDADMLVEGARVDELDGVAARVLDSHIFKAEREVIDLLKTIRPVRTMLGGK